MQYVMLFCKLRYIGVKYRFGTQNLVRYTKDFVTSGFAIPGFYFNHFSSEKLNFLSQHTNYMSKL